MEVVWVNGSLAKVQELAWGQQAGMNLSQRGTRGPLQVGEITPDMLLREKSLEVVWNFKGSCISQSLGSPDTVSCHNHLSAHWYIH